MVSVTVGLSLNLSWQRMCPKLVVISLCLVVDSAVLLQAKTIVNERNTSRLFLQERVEMKDIVSYIIFPNVVVRV